MRNVPHRSRFHSSLSLGALCCTLAALPAFSADPLATPAAEAVGKPEQVYPPASQGAPDLAALNPPGGPDLSGATGAPGAPGAAAPSQNVTINLINRLVERGVLTKQDSSDLIKLAEEDAAVARVQAATTQHDLASLREVTAAQTAPPADDDSVRVTYIPDVVKQQMREQIKNDVMAQAREENWAAPRTLPPWVMRFTFNGDIRVRYEGMSFPSGNDNTGAFPNFNSINTGAPFDVSGNIFSPQNNVDQDRDRFRLRARFGVNVDLGDGFTAGFRIGTGQDDSPVTENQSLGVANQGQGGNFSKYAVWLDRGFIRWDYGPENKHLAVSVGRFDNPFFTISPMIWATDLGFDGGVVQGKYEVLKGFTPFITGGAFPVFNTDLNFSSNQPAKFKSSDKYLYAGQVGAEWKIAPKLTAKFGAAYYYFDNVAGKLSDPFTPLTSSDQGNTDDTRPSFAQTGNTYMALRNIVANADNNFGTTNQFQYFGLATPFHELALTGKLDYNGFEPVQISLYGEWVRNLAFDRNAINAIAVNNRGADTANGAVGSFSGGDTAWIVGVRFGHSALERFGDWNIDFNYRYVESDSVVDGFADADFGGTLLGTNHKGYVVGGNLALNARVWFGLRWMSATEIAGPPFKNDLIQFDINGKF